MRRPDSLPRPVRAGFAAVGVAGAVALAGCGATAGDAAETTDTTGGTDSSTTDAGSSSTGDVSYADGTYTAEGSYATPESVETITVTLTLESDVITDVEVTGDPQRPESEQYQGQFIAGISDEVVGQDIDDIAVSRVAGSSLTSGGFNQAVEAIKADAAA